MARLRSLAGDVDMGLELERVLDVAAATEHSPQATARQLNVLERYVRRWEGERDRAGSMALKAHADEHTPGVVAATPKSVGLVVAAEAVPVFAGCRAVSVKATAAAIDAFAVKAWVADLSTRDKFGAAAERSWEA